MCYMCINNEEMFLRDFIEIVKRKASEFLESCEEMFL